MAVIAISRQVAALGDEIAAAAARRLGYKFIDRKQIEEKIVQLGFPKEKLSKYDEKKPGFFASLVKDRDEYLNYLQCAVLEAASEGNCILIGRGAFIILENLPNLLSFRFIAKDSVRMERLKAEFSWNDKQAQSRITESDSNRRGFHKSFFNLEHEDPQHFILTMNTGILTVPEAAGIIENLVKTCITSEKEAEGKKMVANLLKCQRLVNQLLFEYKVGINFLHAVSDSSGSFITLQGVADSQAAVDRTVQLAAKILPSCSIKSAITVVQDFKNYQ